MQRAQYLLKLLEQPGDPIEFGCKEFELKKFTELAREKYPHLRLCIISGWMILDCKGKRGVKGEGASRNYMEVVLSWIFLSDLLEDVGFSLQEWLIWNHRVFL